MIRISITGASGFVGTNFISRYHNLEIQKINLSTQKVEDLDFKGITTVLHLAALVHQMKGASEEQYFRINRDLTLEVARKAKEHGVKHFVLMSTAKVYGESTTNKPPWDESSECFPLDAYGKSKLEAEKLVFALSDSNFKVAIVRSPLVYGAGVKGNMYNLLNLINKASILPFAGIQNKRTLVYVGNLVALLKHIIDTQSSGIFIAGDNESISTTVLVEIINKSFGKSPLLIKIPYFFRAIAGIIRPSFVERLFGSLELDNYSTNKKLEFVPPYTSEQGIREMVDWFNNINTNKK